MTFAGALFPAPADILPRFSRNLSLTPIRAQTVHPAAEAAAPPPGPRPIVLPPRRRRPSTMAPADERQRRRSRDQSKGAMIDAVWSVLRGLEDVPFALSAEQRTWLEGLILKRCRTHQGDADAEPCPGAPKCASTESLRAGWGCQHACPGVPACRGSLGRMLSCEFSRLVFDLECSRAIAKPISCHVPGCPDCEPQRQAKHALHYEAIVASFDPRDIVLTVFTAQNPEAGELAAGLRAHARHLAKLQRTPLMTGNRPCVARTSDGGPFHRCLHKGCIQGWKCRSPRGLCVAQSAWSRGQRRRLRRRCRLLERHGRPCDHPACRPNCQVFRHRGVVGGVWSRECPPAEGRSGGTWNLHTNGILALRPRDGHRVPWLADFVEVSWYWARATCPTHRRCPGKPICEGGAWDVHLEAFDPKDGIREYIKYVTKPTAILDAAGAGGLVEFMLARRRLKFLSAFGSFFGRKIAVDPDEQAKADADLDWYWTSDTHKERMPKVCPFHGGPARWAPMPVGQPTIVARVELALVGGFLSWTAPP